MPASYYVRALWDPEAEVWVSQSDIPGLVIEADMLSEFADLVQALAPDMLAANLNVHDATVAYDFSARWA